jgi:hypothetical protein
LKKAILVLAAAVFYPLLAAPVTGGFIRVTPDFFTPGTFHLTGPDFDVTGIFLKEFGWPTSVPCLPLDTGSCPVFGFAAGTDFVYGSGGSGPVGWFAHVLWGYLDAEGPSIFELRGPNVSIPGPGTFTGTFSFTGALCGTLPPWDGRPEPCDLNLPSLTGTGRVAMTAEITEYGSLDLTEVTFTFLTPEPNTFFLCVPAALLIVAARRLFRA